MQVYQALSPAHSGRADASIAEVAARMARAKVGRSYGSAREALLLSASFVTAQLQNAGDATAPFISSLTAEVSCQHDTVPARIMVSWLVMDAVCTRNVRWPTMLVCTTQAEAYAQQPAHGAMTIREPGGSGAEAGGAGSAEPMDADEEFARQLQAKMDAKDARKCAEGSWSAITLCLSCMCML